jgi:hypothetical protein
MKHKDEPKPAVSYHAADEEVQLHSPDYDLPEINQTAEFSSDPRHAPAAALLNVAPPVQATLAW